VLVLAHLFNAFNARSETTSAFSHFFSNPWLLGALVLSLLLQVAVVNVGFLNLAFGTVPLTLDHWLLCAGMASGVLWYSELRKWIGRILSSD
jgi:Ca2+-transporting ATPase